ncbi:MAG TPA: ABC transporter permease, partial [Phenylobacterium sp.]|nr:ABC transporter permease [Phenylobacterium sp.]
MNLAGLSLAYLKDRALNTALNVLLLTLSVATLFSSQLTERFTRDAAGIDLVVGAKGSPLQLILASIYQVDVPTGNIPGETVEQLRADPTVGEVIPLAQGDSFRGFRIIGTEPAYVEHYGGQVAQGRMFAAPFEAVMGAQAARQLGAGLGQKFIGSHGLSGDGHDHDQTPFELVGVLAPTGAVLDRLIVTPAESVWAAHGIPLPGARDEHDHDHDEDHAAEAAHATHGGEPDVTALLVKYRSTMAAVRLPRMINDQAGLQAAVPA